MPQIQILPPYNPIFDQNFIPQRQPSHSETALLTPQGPPPGFEKKSLKWSAKVFVPKTTSSSCVSDTKSEFDELQEEIKRQILGDDETLNSIFSPI